MQSWLSTWQRYWFSEIDPHSYAILRIGLGLVGILGLIGLTPLSMYWPSDGLAPIPGSGVGVRRVLIDSGIAPFAGYALYAALWASFASMVIGYRTATAVVLCFLGSALQGFWNSLPLSSSHKVLTALLFCLMWADCGRVLSVDAWRGPVSVDGGVRTSAVWPLRLLRIQVSLIYLSSGITKLFGGMWRDGTALHYVLQMNAFHRFPTPLPGGAAVALTMLTYATLVWEIGFVLLVANRRTRTATLWVGVLMHLAMAFMLELGTFSAVMLTAYVAFVDPASISKRVASLRGTRFVVGVPAQSS
jgi:hypothetical protein